MSVRHLEWLNLNSQRAYPFSEDATRTDDTGNFVLPNTFLVDAVIAVDSVEMESLYLKQLTLLPDVVTLLLYNQDNTPVGTATLATSSHTPNNYYVIQGLGDFTTLRGKLTIGDLPLEIGNYTFTAAATTLETRVLIPNLRGVSSIGIYSQDVNAPAPLENHIKLIEGFNIRLSYDFGKNGVRIDAIEGAGLGTGCVCDDPGALPARPIKFINGIPGDSSRNFNITGIGCISVTPVENGIQIENTCEEPCCDCEDVANLEDVIATLQNRITTLEGRIATVENC